MPKIYSETQLNQLCKHYQKLLRLEDWNIEVQLVHQSTMPKANGRLEYDPGYKAAILKIPTPDSYNTDQIGYPQQHMLHGIIHELVHLQFGVIDSYLPDDSEVSDQLYEQGVNLIANVLVEYLPPRFFCPSCGVMHADARRIKRSLNYSEKGVTPYAACDTCQPESIEDNEEGDNGTDDSTEL